MLAGSILLQSPENVISNPDIMQQVENFNSKDEYQDVLKTIGTQSSMENILNDIHDKIYSVIGESTKSNENVSNQLISTLNNFSNSSTNVNLTLPDGTVLAKTVIKPLAQLVKNGNQ